MTDQEENLDLLDLEDTNDADALPEATPFSAPRPRRPWLLMGLGIAVIALATWIIIARVGSDSGTSVSVDLDAPVVVADVPPMPADNLNVPPKPVDVQPMPQPVPVQQPAPMPQPVVNPQPMPKPVDVKPVESDGKPIRVIEDRKEVVFNPDKPAPAPKPVAKPQQPKKITAPTKKPKATSASVSTGAIYVQFGSYSTRELAQAAESKIRSAHQNLFNGKQFVILAADVKGKTTYRLRVAFNSANDANGFCRNAKSDGLDCYVTK